MTHAVWLAGGFVVLATVVHLASILIAIRRCRRPRHVLQAPPGAPGVSIVRPVCGIDTYDIETLGSAFQLDYPNYEIIFCAALTTDPAVPVVNRLIEEHPHVRARLLIGNETIGDNPKLNNVYKGWRAATYNWVVLADCNVLMPRDYLQRLLAAWRRDTGLVSSPPIGSRPLGFWAELECAFLNTYQARWQYVADTIGFGFAQGKSMLYRRSELDEAGGMRALASEPAEDAATTKIVRRMGLRVRLVDAPFEQPLGQRSATDVWNRQMRWARLRRVSFRSWYMLEILAGSLPPLVAALYVLAALQLPPAGALAFAVVWYGAEATLARAAGWPMCARSPLAWMARDLLLPALWIASWAGTGFVWRGHHMRPVESQSST